MGVPDKVGVRSCEQCALPLGRIILHVTLEVNGEVVDTKSFHATESGESECMDEYYYDSRLKDAIDREVRREMNEMTKRVCPTCIRRLR